MKKILLAGSIALSTFFFTGCEQKIVYVDTPMRTMCTSFANQIDCDNPKTNYFYTQEYQNQFPVTYKKVYVKKCETIEFKHIHNCCYSCQ